MVMFSYCLKLNFVTRCPTTPGQQIAGEQTVVTDAQGNPGRSISLDVFQFPDSHKVGLVATMAVCETGNDTKCQVVSLYTYSQFYGDELGEFHFFFSK